MPPSAAAVHSHALKDVQEWLDACTPTADPLVTHRSLTTLVEHVMPLVYRIEMLEARADTHMQHSEAQQVKIEVLEKTVDELETTVGELRDNNQAMQTCISTMQTRMQELMQQHTTT